MQIFRIIPEDEFMSDSLEALNNNALSLRSNFSGDDFPDEVIIGQSYYQPVENGKGKVYYCHTKDGDTPEDCFTLAIDLDAGVASDSDFQSHISNITNPHKVTASQVGTYDKASLDTTFSTFAKKDLSNVSVASIPEFTGATATTDGTAGIMPAISKEDYNKFLRGDGTFQYIKTGLAAFPVGYRMPWDGDIIPDGWVEEKGQLLNREDYPEGWSFAVSYGMVVTDVDWINQHLKGKFSSGDGTTTFRMPDRRGIYDLYGENNIGKGVDPGLPDINGQGYWNFLNLSADYANSALYTTNDAPEHIRHTNGNEHSGNAMLRFKASRSNPIYGRSNTVTPPSIITRSIRKMK